MNTGIFDTEHFEAAYPVIRLFDQAGNKVFFFSDSKTSRHLREMLGATGDRITWYIKGDKEPLYKFILRMHKACRQNKIGLMYFNTISNNHVLYALLIMMLRRTRVIVTLHSINCMYLSKAFFSWRGIIRHIGKKLLLRHTKELNVISETMTGYLKKFAGRSTVVHTIPGAIFEGRTASAGSTQILKLVVPGTIDKKRRDYIQVFELAEIAERNQLPLQIVLLGAPAGKYGTMVINEAKAYAGIYTKISWYKDRIVAQAEFDRQLSGAHFVFIPSVIDTETCDAIPETYGVTKSSGNIFDAVKHARPLIIPSRLQVPASLESSCYRYSDLQTLYEFLLSLALEPSLYTQWDHNALVNSEYYSVANVVKRHPSLFDSPAD